MSTETFKVLSHDLRDIVRNRTGGTSNQSIQVTHLLTKKVTEI